MCVLDPAFGATRERLSRWMYWDTRLYPRGSEQTGSVGATEPFEPRVAVSGCSARRRFLLSARRGC